MRAKSLTTRTVLVAVAAQLLCAAILCTAALLHELHTRSRAMDAQIQGSSDSLLGAVQDAEDVDANVTIDPAELKLPSQDAFAVYNQDGRLLGTSPNAPAKLIARGLDGFREVYLPGENYRVLQRNAVRIIDRAEHGGVGLRRPVTIVYAMPEGHLHHEVFEAASFYIVTVLLATCVMALLLPALIRRTLRPLSDLASATSVIHPPDFQFIPPASAVELDELRPLSEMLNQSLNRVRESFAREQQFVSDAAHELKTAVAVVQSSVQLLLLKRRSEEEYRSGLERTVEDVHRLETLIAQMLQMARLENTTYLNGMEVIDLGEVAHKIAEQFRPLTEMRQVCVGVQATPRCCIQIRREFAETLISNLLLNAIQHSTPRSVGIVISVESNAGEISLRVIDRGCGIQPEALPHIFDRFYREDISRSRETGGAGLGLAIVKSIVDAAHGRIQVESTPGVGTIMYVTFRSA